MARQYEKILLVEGAEDQRVIPELVNIELKASGLKIFGIIVDADDEPANRWQSIRNCLLERYPDIPEELPATGLIHHGEIKIGVWMMPDNRERGMLETFLQFLLPDNDKNLWKFTEQSCKQASNCGASYKEAHLDKAKIHTWLAWQNPPGRQLHDAVKQRILSPGFATGGSFHTVVPGTV